MRSLKSAILVCRRASCSGKQRIDGGLKGFTSLSCNPLMEDSDNLVLVEGHAGSRTAILNRPSSLNAINTSLVAQLQKLFQSWEENPNVGFVTVKGAGRAFSAGGDIVSLYNLMKEGNIEECKKFFWTIYSYIYFLGTSLKPHVALLNGITMGGGAGISIPGMIRVATEKTIFATPETLIGFHPDAAASFYLSHLPGYLGEYFALTGAKLNGQEMLSCGLATHFTPITKLPLLEEQLSQLVTDDPCVIESNCASFGESVIHDPSSVIHRVEMIDKIFSHDTVEEIIDALETEASKNNDVWCASTLKKLNEAAPLSLKVALRSVSTTAPILGSMNASFFLNLYCAKIREGRFQTLDECLIREYRMSLQGISRKITGDFYEGVRAKLVHKDFTPKWDPPSLKYVTQDMVDEYFTRLNAFEPELQLPTQQREAFT